MSKFSSGQWQSGRVFFHVNHVSLADVGNMNVLHLHFRFVSESRQPNRCYLPYLHTSEITLYVLFTYIRNKGCNLEVVQ